MSTQEILETLHPLERKVLPTLSDNIGLDEIINKSKLSGVEATRALQWMENKGILKITKSERIVVDLDVNGKAYLKKGLPEKRFLKVLDKEMKLEDIAKEADLDNDEMNICLGILKRKAAISVVGGIVSPTGKRDLLVSKKMPEEDFLRKLPVQVATLNDEQKSLLNLLLKRKDIIATKREKIITAGLTLLGKKVVEHYKKAGLGDMIDRLTPKMLKEGSWKGKTFRRYDVEINVPRIYGARRHFVNQAVEYARRIWLDLGFREMTGPLLQTSFWNFDALFTAQDHPVRDLQDTYYIKDPEYGRLPAKAIVDRVRKTHESGWTTGSRGWEYKWDPMDSRRNCMRTHTTCLSARTLASLKMSDLPAKFFSIGKCFRNETMDWSHLFEFYQVEGIVVDPDSNFRQLIGLLTNFFLKMGYEKVRVRPGYFPYTEMSAEVDVYDKNRKKWIELAGSGMFRPEVVKPLLGEDVPVLAWGLGFPRTISDYYRIDDIREIYRNDLKQLRETRIWMM